MPLGEPSGNFSSKVSSIPIASRFTLLSLSTLKMLLLFRTLSTRGCA